METTLQSSAAPRRRTTVTPSQPLFVAAPASPAAAKATPALLRRAQNKKLPKAAVESMAVAFFEAFRTLPGAVQWHVVQKIEAYEDELDEAQLMADMAANPQEYARENAVPFEQVKAELEERDRQAAADSVKKAT